MRKPDNKIRLIAFLLVLPLLAAGAARANTVDIVHDDYGAYGAMTFWGGGHNGNVIMGGVYQLNKTNSTGIGDTWHNGQVSGFCTELHEYAPQSTHTYAVTMPDDVYNSFTGEVLGVTRANYLRELWARFYDPSWAAGGTYTEQQNGAAEAFAAAIWEIVYEKLPASSAGWDVTVDGTVGIGGFRAENLDVDTANKWLHDLTGSGPKADLLAFVHDGEQNYLVAVPEPATIILLGLGGMCSVLGRRRRPA
jgi:hypothetical protein